MQLVVLCLSPYCGLQCMHHNKSAGEAAPCHIRTPMSSTNTDTNVVNSCEHIDDDGRIGEVGNIDINMGRNSNINGGPLTVTLCPSVLVTKQCSRIDINIGGDANVVLTAASSTVMVQSAVQLQLL